MVRVKNRPQRETQHFIPVNTGPEPTAEEGTQSDHRSETSSQHSTYCVEDVPLADRIERPAKRRKFGDKAPHDTAHHHPQAAQATWHACKCCMDEQAHDFFPLKSVPLVPAASKVQTIPKPDGHSQPQLLAQSSTMTKQILFEMPEWQLEVSLCLYISPAMSHQIDLHRLIHSDANGSLAVVLQCLSARPMVVPPK